MKHKDFYFASHDLSAEEESLLKECLNKIGTHLDRHIRHADDNGLNLNRLLIFRQHMQASTYN